MKKPFPIITLIITNVITLCLLIATFYLHKNSIEATEPCLEYEQHLTISPASGEYNVLSTSKNEYGTITQEVGDSLIVTKGEDYIGVMEIGWYPTERDSSSNMGSPIWACDQYDKVEIINRWTAVIVVPTDTINMEGTRTKEIKKGIMIKIPDPVIPDSVRIVEDTFRFFVVEPAE